MNLGKISEKTIEYSFYVLFFLVPLIWLPFTSELFEFNKMILVYLLTAVVTGAWLIKSLVNKKFELTRTTLDIPILIFLIANILSTIFSMDPHTSIFGYYGRWHGGLLSTFSYIILYYALVTHFDRQQIYYYLTTLLTSGLIISIYAVLQHPNPLFRETLDGKTIFHGIDYDYWAVDVENRVFGTLGQPNWLAALLSMLIFPLISLLFIFKKLWQQFLVLLAIAVYFLAFTFTYSRGGLLGLLVGAATFVILFPIYKKTLVEKIKAKVPLLDLSQTLEKLKAFLLPILALTVLVVVVNFFFGNAIEKRGGLETETKQAQKEQSVSRGTQLETGGTQTAKIRTIVWQGAFDIFKHYPILGSGVETFGYSYYLFRPQEHNLTVEWDYLYNKAHNEYLNYLATTGSLGFLSYIFLITLFEIFAAKQLIFSNFNTQRLLSLGLFAGFNANLALNFFGFSVVTTALLFFTFPAMFFLINDYNSKTLVVEFKNSLTFLNKKTFNQMAILFSMALTSVGILLVLSMWTADVLYESSKSAGTYERSIRQLRTAIRLNPTEPLYQAELSDNLSQLATKSKVGEEIDTKTKTLASEASNIIIKVVKNHPADTALWIDKRTIDFNLSKVDRAYELELLRTAEKLKVLAPTDASIQYDVALVYLYLDKDKEAIKQLENVVEIKPDYREAVLMLSRTYKNVNDQSKAINLLEDWLKKNPNDTEAKSLLSQLATG